MAGELDSGSRLSFSAPGGSRRLGGRKERRYISDMYHYLGNARLQFAFFLRTCAAFLVVTALLTAGVFLLLVSRRGVLPKIGAGFLGFAILKSNKKYIFN